MVEGSLQIDGFLKDWKVLCHFFVELKVGVAVFDVKVVHEEGGEFFWLVGKRASLIFVLEVDREDSLFLIFLEDVVADGAAQQAGALNDVYSQL